ERFALRDVEVDGVDGHEVAEPLGQAASMDERRISGHGLVGHGFAMVPDGPAESCQDDRPRPRPASGDEPLAIRTRVRVYPPAMRVGEVAERAGVNVETLRYYERRGLLPEPGRSPGGHREYDEDAVRFVRAVKEAQTLGFSLSEIAEYISLTRRS